MLFNNVCIIIDVRWAYQNHNLDVKEGKECALVKILHMWGYKAIVILSVKVLFQFSRSSICTR